MTASARRLLALGLASALALGMIPLDAAASPGHAATGARAAGPGIHGPGIHGPGAPGADASGRSPWVTGYYAGWFWQWLYPPEQVDMSAMTHFVFGRVAPGGGSLGGKPGHLKLGAVSAQKPEHSPFPGTTVEDYLVERAHDAGTKALLMLGGDGDDGDGFLRSTTAQRRERFVERIVDYLVEHDYDGVDVDWESCLHGERDCGERPGATPVSKQEARMRLRLLIDDLRDEAATRKHFRGRPILITLPGYAVSMNELTAAGRVPAWQARLAMLVDQYNLMSYGVGTTFNGAGWNSWFTGALDGETTTAPVSIASSVDAYVRTGVPRRRIGIGIGFFGIYYGPQITGPRQNTDENEIWETHDPSLAYSELDRKGYLDAGELHWDDAASSTYRVYDGGYVPASDPAANPAGMLSYEDERSIAAKGAWVRAGGAGGTIVWTLNYGWLPDRQQNPLLDAVAESFLDR